MHYLTTKYILIGVVVIFSMQWLIMNQSFALNYDHDALNRLESASYDNGQTVNFNYDNAGNLNSITSAISSFGVEGIISDELGNPLAGVTVSIDGQNVTTDANGYYQISGLTGGNYLVTAALAGFSLATQNILLDAINPGGDGSALLIAHIVIPDVPTEYWAHDEIQAMFANGIAEGCVSDDYCPEQLVTRASLAIYLLRAMHGDQYSPPAATGLVFDDVSVNDFAADWIEQLFAEGIADSCDTNLYCPTQVVTREHLAIMLLRARYGAAYIPPAASGLIYGDVAINDFAADWIEQL